MVWGILGNQLSSTSIQKFPSQVSGPCFQHRWSTLPENSVFFEVLSLLQLSPVPDSWLCLPLSVGTEGCFKCCDFCFKLLINKCEPVIFFSSINQWCLAKATQFYSLCSCYFPHTLYCWLNYVFPKFICWSPIWLCLEIGPWRRECRLNEVFRVEA